MEVSPCSKASACVFDMPGRNDIGLMVFVLVSAAGMTVEEMVVDAVETMGRHSTIDDVT